MNRPTILSKPRKISFQGGRKFALNLYNQLLCHFIITCISNMLHVLTFSTEDHFRASEDGLCPATNKNEENYKCEANGRSDQTFTESPANLGESQHDDKVAMVTAQQEEKGMALISFITLFNILLKGYQIL